MSNREMAIDLINRIPENKLGRIIVLLKNAVVSDDVPNDETIEAIEELENGGGTRFEGSTKDFLKGLLG